MSDAPSGSTPPQGPPAQAIIVNTPGTGAKIPILFGIVVVLAGACAYLFYQMNQLQSQLTQTRDSMSSEISKLYEASTVSSQTSRRNIENLEKDLAQARAQATQLSGQAKADASKHADQLAARLEAAQQEQSKKVAAVSNEVSQVKTDATATNARIDGVTSDVGTVKTDVAKNRTDLEKTIADLKSTRGDLGMQSGLIATNGKELSALKALGQRNYTEFKIAKSKKAEKVGDLMVRLEKADPKHNRYTIEVTADDKKVEKKDRTVNEPVQFILSRATQPYELVVNDVKKNLITGYLSAPKVQQPRGQGQ